MSSKRIIEQNGRKYRSKKQRPCDLCRSRKTHCRISGSDSSCDLCKKRSRECTFLQKPLKRAQISQINSDNVDRPDPHQPNDMSVCESQNDPHPVTVEESSFWIPQIDQDRSLRALSSLPMDWPAVNLSSIGN